MKAAAKARCALQLLCASTCLAPGAAVAEPSFRIIGPSPQATTLFDVSLSDDGRVAGVSINTPAMSGGAWLNDLVADTTTLLASGRFATPPAVSADGAVAMTLLFNLGLGSSLVRYSDGTLTAIADAGNTVTSLSDDGQHYTGFVSSGVPSSGHAYVATWEPGFPVLTLLDDLPGGIEESAAWAMSRDGEIVVGFGTQELGTEAMRWDAVNGMVGLGDLDGGDFYSEALDLSADGTTIVGFGNSARGMEAALWSGAALSGLGDLPGGGLTSVALAVTGDGSRVVGRGTDASGSAAFIWDAAHGMRDLKTVLLGYGVDVGDVALLSATDISADGLTIAGNGRDALGRPLGWVAVIPEPADEALLACDLALLAVLRRRASADTPRA